LSESKKESVAEKKVNRRSMLKWGGALAVAAVGAVAGATELMKRPPPPISVKPPPFQTGTLNSEIQTSTGVSTTAVNTTVSNSVQTSTTVFNPTGQHPRLLAKASDIPLNDSRILNDETFGSIILIHLDNGQFVAYSALCTHAGCSVTFDQSRKVMACANCCLGYGGSAEFDPYNDGYPSGNATLPLQQFAIQYDPATGNIYLAG
jgi:Rieske Fe-S protein